MQCSICLQPVNSSSMDDPTCWLCSEGAHNIFNLINKLETENGNDEIFNLISKLETENDNDKSLWNASKWVVGLTKRLSFLHEMVDAYRNLTPSDIFLKPANNESSIAAHRGLLATRSKIFKIMLESDTCKAPHFQSITLPELNHEELEAFLEFLYRGSLPQQKLEKHIYPLSLAAHKYEIIYLSEFCQNYMLKTLNSCNALLVLEISDFCSFLTTRDETLRFIVKHVEDIVLSSEYEAFAVKNPRLSVQITRALLKDAKKK